MCMNFLHVASCRLLHCLLFWEIPGRHHENYVDKRTTANNARLLYSSSIVNRFFSFFSFSVLPLLASLEIVNRFFKNVS
jgi:hypothetical protein